MDIVFGFAGLFSSDPDPFASLPPLHLHHLYLPYIICLPSSFSTTRNLLFQTPFLPVLNSTPAFITYLMSPPTILQQPFPCLFIPSPPSSLHIYFLSSPKITLRSQRRPHQLNDHPRRTLPPSRRSQKQRVWPLQRFCRIRWISKVKKYYLEGLVKIRWRSWGFCMRMREERIQKKKVEMSFHENQELNEEMDNWRKKGRRGGVMFLLKDSKR
jgi:hypothetical protein